MSLSLTQGQRSHTSIQQEGGHLPAKRIFLVGSLILDFPASINVRNKCLLLKPCREWYFVMAALAELYNEFPWCHV